MQQNELTKCQAQLQQLTTEFEEFAYIVSHDLKAPVRAIYNLAGWIEEDLGEDVPVDVKQNIRLLQNRADRMERMIQALLTFSRVNRLDLEQSEVDTEQLIWQTWQQINPEADQLLQLEGAFPVFTTYGLKLQHVFEQLLKNAVSFTSQPQAKITVTATESDDYYTFTVKDTGPGIPEEALPKVFSMFYTVTSKDKLDTTGAGLAIARKIVLFARGDIQIQSEVGKGTTVQFTWPKIITQNQQAS